LTIRCRFRHEIRQRAVGDARKRNGERTGSDRGGGAWRAAPLRANAGRAISRCYSRKSAMHSVPIGRPPRLRAMQCLTSRVITCRNCAIIAVSPRRRVSRSSPHGIAENQGNPARPSAESTGSVHGCSDKGGAPWLLYRFATHEDVPGQAVDGSRERRRVGHLASRCIHLLVTALNR
jgi:hypothetical protein